MDKRYKIVNYATRHHRVEIDGKRPILWPFAIYSVNIPSVKEKDINIFELNEAQAIELLKSGKQGVGPKVVKDLTGGIEVRDGRYGMYIKDGKINAKMPKNITPDELTLEEEKKIIKTKKNAPKRKFRKR